MIGAAIEVHGHLGPGLLEAAYEECLAREFDLRSVPYERQKPLPIAYKGIELDCAFRLDFLVDERLVLELKSVEAVLPIHQAQLLTYLKLTGCKLGLLLNFNTRVMQDGIERIAHGL